jgi:hypothetical protein
MSSKGSPAKLPNGLTPKQTRFVKQVVKNITETGDMKTTEAALNVYDTTNNAVAAGIASENLNKPAVKSALEEAFRRAGLTDDVLGAELADLALSKPKVVSADVKLRTITELLKLRGAYPSNKQPVSGHSTTINIGNISFTDAKEKLLTLHGESTEFMDDAE